MKTKLAKILPILTIIFLISCPPAEGLENSHSPEYEHVKTLTEIGPRLAGTEEEIKAVRYIENELENYGLSVKVRDFQLENGYVYKGGRLVLQSPFKENLEFTPLIRSPPTEGELKANLKHIENITENTGSLKNDIVLTEKKNFSKIKEIPTGAIILYEENKPAWANVWPSNSLKCPTVTVSYDTAEFLISLLENSNVENVALKFVLDSELETLTSHNVVATLQGSIDEEIIVTSHHDTVFSPGAIGGGTGVAVMLETARELSDENLERTVKFVSFGAEEYGLSGSEQYLKDVEANKIAGVLNLGPISPGPSNGLRIGFEEFPGVNTTRWLDKGVGKVAEDIGLDYDYGEFEEIRRCGDNYSFISFVKNDIPTTQIYWITDREDNPLWMIHTTEDELELVSENNLESVSKLSVNSVRRLSTVGGWIWDYESPKKIALFTILSSIFIVFGIAGSSYLRYIRKRKNWQIIVKTFLVVLVGIAGLFFWLFWFV